MTQTALPGLVTPPRLPQNTLRIVPLGGLGEIGRNMTVFEIGGKLLIVDCGVLFPEETQPGVDLILPDFSYIENRVDDIVAVILTHGHEDHIGAVPYLLRLRNDIPLVGSQLTLALIEAKLQEHRIRPNTKIVNEGQVEKFGPFECEFVAVNHSIPDALAVFIRTAAGTVLHTGDFKMDQLPLDGRITDLRAFARLGEEGVDLFMSDSTNADVPGFTTAEQEIGPVLDGCSHGPASGSSSPPSPRMCTASSRSSTPRPPTGARSPSSAGPWCGTWASPPAWGTWRSRPGSSWTSRTSASCRTSAWC